MRTRTAAPTLALLLALLGLPPARAFAQAPGFAEILTPTPGAPLEGLVTIIGTADHPAFDRYDLAFAYDPLAADTWFPLGEPTATRVQRGTLGLWDTQHLSPGTYQLRLRVFLDNGAVLEHTVGGLRVGLPTVTPPATGPRPTASPTPTPTATPLPFPSEAEAASSADPVLLSVGIGGLTAAAFLVLLAVYLPLRRGLALWAGDLRMRRVLRQDQRRRRARP